MHKKILLEFDVGETFRDGHGASDIEFPPPPIDFRVNFRDGHGSSEVDFASRALRLRAVRLTKVKVRVSLHLALALGVVCFVLSLSHVASVGKLGRDCTEIHIWSVAARRERKSW